MIERSAAAFQYRHSFGYRTDQSATEAMALDVKNSRDIPDAVPNAPRLATFTLRARSAVLIDHPSVHEQHRTDQYHDAERSRLLEHATVRPNISDKETVVNLAKMTSDAYLFDPREPDWLNTTLGFNFTGRFGWKEDGLRAHVFTTEDYNTVVVAFKGTTLDPTNRISGRDAINDNRLFSCCCRAQNPYHYPPVCDCPTGYYQCKSSCLTSSVLQNDSYYDAALDIMGRTQAMYPQATFWTVGHSLGGSLASLVGLTLNIPAVTFEAPPERLAAQRMGLVSSNHNTTIKAGRAIAHHFGNTADPVYMGACNGFFSSCSFWGFSFESQCFTGKRCAYDTVKDKGWRSSINNHRISNVIENVLKAYDDVPACEEDTECEDCYLWKFS